LLIDGEWIQDAADDLVTEMMRKYNKEKAIVFNTFADVSLGSFGLPEKNEQAKKRIFSLEEISS
jgi:proline dehydrogenase